MYKILTALALTFSALFGLGACQTNNDLTYPSEYAGGQIVTTQVYEQPDFTYVMSFQALFPQIPSYNGNGLLAASWTPSDDIFNNPAYVVLHGGRGVGPASWRTAGVLHQSSSANVLVLDSFLTRGAEENSARSAWGDAKVRTFDVIPKGKWLKKKGTDPKKTWMIGGSQGGWTTLKAMSLEPLQISEVKPLFAGGIAYYPVCDNYNEKGNLRPNQRYISLADRGYWGPILILSGKKDYAPPISGCQPNVLKFATKHVSFDRGTHGWQSRWREKDGTMNKDGSCISNHNGDYQMCYDEGHTNQTYIEIRKFILQKR